MSVIHEPLADATATPVERRVRLQLEGLIQGVGFRPHVKRLASTLGLRGWVANSGDGVTIDIEGTQLAVADFLQRLDTDRPPLARIDRLRSEPRTPAGHTAFTIRDSAIAGGEQTALVLPDIATCADCLAELFSPAQRRYRYPFTSCTNCGPRFSILETLPFERANTSMRGFTLCSACVAEYVDPSNRRCHAQANACPHCGPHLTLMDPAGTVLAERDPALLAAAGALRSGRIVALKGLGGFQLLVDARNAHAVAELRRRKQRPHKPFAIMAATAALIELHCHTSQLERALLRSPEAPIVLLRRRAHMAAGAHLLAPSIAPNNPLLGAMLAYTPVHHLLLREVGFPIVATSGNAADEPLVSDTATALARLRAIADVFLVHDRPITNALDDSVVRVVAGRALALRRARGYAPLAVALPRAAPPILALGGHLKSSTAITLGARAIVGPHVGNLDTASARQGFHRVIDRMRTLHAVRPQAVACDRHPHYYTSAVAARGGAPVIAVQHHLAHIIACMADNAIEGPALGIAWDGTGFGDDGTLCGSEFIFVAGVRTRRIAHLRPFPLPGGNTAVAEPRRAAIGLLYEGLGKSALDEPASAPVQVFSRAEREVLRQMLARGFNAPRTSSIGRLFDAVASLLGLIQRTSFEGQAAMALEFALDEQPAQAVYPLRYDDAHEPGILDWDPLLHALLADIERGARTADIAAAFHNALVEAIVTIAAHVGETRVVLSGGCFQNRYLTERTIARLRDAGFEPYWHRQLPPNDGGLALGQAVWAARVLAAGVA